MAVLTTLATTTLVQSVGAGDGEIKVASTADIRPGLRLYADRELMIVTSLGVSPWVNVRRGTDGTPGVKHANGVTLYIGEADKFFQQDPPGMPPVEVLVSPHINVVTGDLWFAQGDAVGVGAEARWWQKQSTTYGTGALGVRTTTTDPTVST